MTGAHGSHHDVVVYDDDIALTDQLLTLIDDASANGGHTLLLLQRRLAEQLASSTPAGFADVVELRTVSEQSSRPVDALEQLWRFAQARLEVGATHILTIGQVHIADAASAPAWLWYEATMLGVLPPLPVHAVCLVDRRVTAPDHLRQLRDAHRPDHPIPPMPRVVLPTTPPSRTFDTTSSAEARRALGALTDGDDPLVSANAAIVLSELVTNAVRHGRSRARVEIWAGPDTLTVSITDDGPGIDDPAASLRPPDLPTRGAGLWLCHKLSDHFSLHNTGLGCQARAQFQRHHGAER